MGKRIVIKTPAARSNSSEGTRKRNNKKGKSPKPRTYRAAWCATCEQGAIDGQHINRTSPGVTAIDGQHINRLLEIYPVVFAGRYWSFIRSNIVVRRALALIKWVFVFR